ncbi:MAG: Gfo/Idh/MocA family oxidoreductase [Leptolyngbyaceae cyanobacterium SL_7_1]|nr:Gfo/Idh/MocA family oxidoreductase [Leptolyngbyaceae cyanobacterium SL_7_1]
MPTTLKAAVIGSGLISKEHLSFLAQSDRAQLVGVCDLSLAAAKYAAQRFQAEQAYTDYRQMLSEASPDVVHILTPPQTHTTIATHCLEAGAHVICEKPIAPTHAEFQALWQVAERVDRQLIENHNYRFNQPIQAIEQLVQQGKLGEVQEVEVRLSLDIRAAGGRFADENLPSPIHKLPAGVIHDFITHLSYLVLRFLPRIDRVGAAWSNHGGGDLFKYDDLDAIVIGGTTHARIRFSCRTQPEGLVLSVRGSEGYVETDLFRPYLYRVIPRVGGKQLSPLVNQWVNGWGLMRASTTNFWNKVMQRTAYEGLHTMLQQTYEALSTNQPLPIRFEDMERTSQLVEALLAEENRI